MQLGSFPKTRIFRNNNQHIRPILKGPWAHSASYMQDFIVDSPFDTETIISELA